MKLVARAKLLPTPEQAEALAATLRACNEAACVLSRAAHEKPHSARSRRALQIAHYRDVKDCGLSAQPALLVICKVADAYRTQRAQIRSGRLGAADSPRRARIEARPITFQSLAAQPFDDRCLSWQHTQRTISIWTVHGRLRAIAFTGREDDLTRIAQSRRGESDLEYIDRAWYLTATLDIAEPAPNLPVATVERDWVGVDLGIVNIAYTSTGKNWHGGAVTDKRKKYRHQRRALQQKNTRSAKRRAKTQRRKESRYVRDTNHVISKRIVTEAQRTGRGIALEDLTGIRERARLRKPQRVTLHSWAFHQLGVMITYKAQQAGVALVHVDPHYTSQRCHCCGHTARSNRKREKFSCQSCRFVDHADHNGARNIAHYAPAAWRDEYASQGASHASNDAA